MEPKFEQHLRSLTPFLDPLAVEVSFVRWHKDNQFGIEFLRYAHGDRERVTDLVEGRKAPAISQQAEQEELTISTVAQAASFVNRSTTRL